jgi:hypothetical protein
VLSLAFAGVVCVGLTGATLSLWRVSVSVLASQVIFHGLFSLGGPGGRLPTDAAAPAGAHDHTAVAGLNLGSIVDADGALAAPRRPRRSSRRGTSACCSRPDPIGVRPARSAPPDPPGSRSATALNESWTASEVEVDLAAPIEDGHGNAITTRPGAVVYTATTPMPDGLRDTFALSLQLPEDAAGETLEFPVLQTCVEGETNWNETTVEGEAEPAHPAPAIVVTAASADGHGHGDEATDAETTDAEPTAATAAQGGDVLARVLGVGGLVVGAVGIVLAVTRRRAQTE